MKIICKGTILAKRPRENRNLEDGAQAHGMAEEAITARVGRSHYLLVYDVSSCPQVDLRSRSLEECCRVRMLGRQYVNMAVCGFRLDKRF